MLNTRGVTGAHQGLVEVTASPAWPRRCCRLSARRRRCRGGEAGVEVRAGEEKGRGEVRVDWREQSHRAESLRRRGAGRAEVAPPCIGVPGRCGHVGSSVTGLARTGMPVDAAPVQRHGAAEVRCKWRSAAASVPVR
jgi:hypothetical protein